PLSEYLRRMAVRLFYPMAVQEGPPPEIAGYVERTERLFSEGSACGDPEARYGHAQQVFDIIEPLIPEDEEEVCDRFLRTILSLRGAYPRSDPTPATHQRAGMAVAVTRRLFTDLDGNPMPVAGHAKGMIELIRESEKDKKKVIKDALRKPKTETHTGSNFDCSNLHRDIKVVVTRPVPDPNLRRAYQNIYDGNRLSISSYNSRFAQLLRARVPAREERRLFGSGINSSRLHDAKRRYWYRSAEDFGVPDLAVLLLIDGSGSMGGGRRESAIVSSVVLHEVLRKQGVTHAIVEHRAEHNSMTVTHNILVDFVAKEEDKLNILTLRSDGGTREGLSLFWAERHLNTMTREERKLIIVLSDGMPSHVSSADSHCVPPVSVKDAADAAAKIMARGTDIIAVALDDGGRHACYDELKGIYPSVVSCTNLKRLTGQLLTIISRSLS
ncbi:MAG: hypothetical protein FWH47_03640, partial [Methanomassiliicoccaceae archaeon]|nr:hypothetical protein [Methanomassiliicoccaceae archaeon]